MDALRHERDVLQNELMKRQQQLKLERHLLREKFEIEKQMLVKTWQEKVAAASQSAPNKSENHQPSEKTFIAATADAMVLAFLIQCNVITLMCLQLTNSFLHAGSSKTTMRRREALYYC